MHTHKLRILTGPDAGRTYNIPSGGRTTREMRAFLQRELQVRFTLTPIRASRGGDRNDQPRPAHAQGQARG